MHTHNRNTCAWISPHDPDIQLEESLAHADFFHGVLIHSNSIHLITMDCQHGNLGEIPSGSPRSPFFAC